MARARNIKPGLYKNEDLAECSIWARYIFPGLWMLADREGRLEDRPKRIKAELLPFDTKDVEPLLAELMSAGFIVRYEVDGVRYIQISKFSEHQTPHVREQASTFPSPLGIEQSIAKAVTNTRQGDDIPSPGSPDCGLPLPSSLNPSEEQAAPVNPARFDPMQHLIALEVTEPVARDWLALRKTKRAPATETAIAGIISEADKASMTLQAALETCCKRGWQGFEAKWLQDGGNARAGPGSYSQQRDAERREVGDILTGRKKANERTSGSERDIPGECSHVAG